MRIKIITNTGYKYSGELIEETDKYIILIDSKEGVISVPLVNVSLIKKEKIENDTKTITKSRV